ncbi:MAG TPA: DUF2029 domain-containing protein [Candidatus Stackebrandtia excrementipullorum]|nr:DUF2029 domain-containing protein [Candidatus Stackebrandtia excrementipullorum]
MDRLRREPLYLDLALYGLAALFAVYTAVTTTLPVHGFWGMIVLGGYVPAALLTIMFLTQPAVAVTNRLVVAIGCGVAVTAFPLVAQVIDRAHGVAGRAQEEVIVIEASGIRLWESGSPYLTSQQIAAEPDPLLIYNPYQPGMSLFGLPRAWFGEHWFTDARIYFAIVTLVAVWAAVRLLAARQVTKSATIRGIQAFFVLPISALTLATGGNDLPVVSLCVLGLVAFAVDRPKVAGLAVGMAAALKLFAWPVLIVVFVLAWRKGVASRFAPAAVGLPLLTLVPFLITGAGAFYDNVFAYPMGQGVIQSTAASPLPGYLLAANVPGGVAITLALLGLVGAGFALYLWRRPVQHAYTAAAICATGLGMAMCLMPSSRFGYLLYPAVFGVWWWILRDVEEPRSPWAVGARRGDNGSTAMVGTDST